MALSSSSSSNSSPIVSLSPFSRPNFFYPSNVSFFHFPIKLNNSINFNYTNNVNVLSASEKWRPNVSFSFPFFLKKGKDVRVLKEELLEAIASLDRGAEASPEDQQRVDELARKLEEVNPTKEPLKSELLNGKWELIYTTSKSILQTQRPKFLRSTTNYQAINVDTLRAQNMESWPFFNQIPIKAPGRARGELEITYLDEELRISRGDKGNLFILKMIDPSYRVPT
ncbi:probable plastid-lipid-associated protein 4, chloroplastic isoform X2 [Mangifera indica]|uniref:probable plastid-lipid-associated protein 4, chloroplastic isoform X2 n=1 Tax=Mangifera indica TaxID=29780 RepID=UPI001CFA3DAE|nr:probable plastid-lipid-associated protein 4, chloroplastic isoform X2 [Mangifera indica]